MMCEYKSCKELAFSTSNLLRDTKLILEKSNSLSKCHPDMLTFLEIGEVFFSAYAYYFLL